MEPSPIPHTSCMNRLKKTAWRASSTCWVARKYFCSSVGAASMNGDRLSATESSPWKNIEYVDTASGDRYVPHVIEPAAGADRATLAFLVDAYDEDEVQGEQRTVLRLHPRLAPIKAAVLPLVRKDGQPELARELHDRLRRIMRAEYDEGGSIGRRYRRQDEIGTPWAVTIDGESLTDQTVTLRDRDSLKQDRIAIDQLGDEIERRLRADWTSPKL